MESTFSDYGKPKGEHGEELLDLMDEGHTPVSLWALTNIKIKEDDCVLDIGCGSGLNIKRLHNKSPKSKTYGIDHSTTSVKKAKLTNQKCVDSGCVEIYEANVLDMPFEDEMFDIITAFETVYFWPDIVNSFKEVKRILKDNGKLFLIFEANGCEDKEMEEIAKREGCIFYKDNQLEQILMESGFTRMKFYLRNRAENTKTIKIITEEYSSIELLDDDYSDDPYEQELKKGDYSPSSQWMCILVEK